MERAHKTENVAAIKTSISIFTLRWKMICNTMLLFRCYCCRCCSPVVVVLPRAGHTHKFLIYKSPTYMRFFSVCWFTWFICCFFGRIFYDLAINDQMTCHETHISILCLLLRATVTIKRKTKKCCTKWKRNCDTRNLGGNAINFTRSRLMRSGFSNTEAGHHFSLPSLDHT